MFSEKSDKDTDTGLDALFPGNNSHNGSAFEQSSKELFSILVHRAQSPAVLKSCHQGLFSETAMQGEVI